MTTVRITRTIRIAETFPMLNWIEANGGKYHYKNGIEFVIFERADEAVIFKIRFGV